MYFFRNNRKIGIYILSLTLLWMFTFSQAAWGAEAPKNKQAADSTIPVVEANNFPKDALVVTAPDSPGSSKRPLDPGSPSSAPTEDPHTVASLSAPGDPSLTSLGPYYANQKPAAPLVADNTPKKGTSLGMFVTTGYCTCEECSSGFGLTYSGTVPKAHHTISADIDRFPIGTRLLIGDTVYTVEDIGSNVTGEHIDIYYDSHEEAMAHGRQMMEVFTIK